MEEEKLNKIKAFIVHLLGGYTMEDVREEASQAFRDRRYWYAVMLTRIMEGR